MTLTLYFLKAITFTFVSWTIGLIVNNAIKNTTFYSKLSDFQFIRSATIYNSLGLSVFAWIIKNSFFKIFNQNIKLKKRASREDLKQIRNEMVYAEIGHIIGFIFILIIIGLQIGYKAYTFALILFVFNVIFNLYPSLLQQKNKKRIDNILKQ
ncbi:hypothetical protein VDP25_05995 [Winogradskyella sp. ECml5-4]|uniref:glycosyl-4,4'-diaponeurosporenoate acyltransferase CrtO family protein n=1 Tax=Winogradskyella sp. ECml5-4 TaxID=3110975 RepID=UPI002FF2FBAB